MAKKGNCGCGCVPPGETSKPNTKAERSPMDKLLMEEIRDTARRIATERLKPRAVETDRERTFPWENMKALGDAGFHRLIISARGLTLHFKTSEWLRQDVAKAALGL